MNQKMGVGKCGRLGELLQNGCIVVKKCSSDNHQMSTVDRTCCMNAPMNNGRSRVGWLENPERIN